MVGMDPVAQAYLEYAEKLTGSYSFLEETGDVGDNYSSAFCLVNMLGRGG